jgi:selenocysteine lyase/cysteine desulfurase
VTKACDSASKCFGLALQSVSFLHANRFTLPVVFLHGKHDSNVSASLLQPDFLVTVGYKWLLRPFGLGYLYVAPEHREGRPLEENWIVRENAGDFTRLIDYRDRYASGARRFDVGQRTSFELTPIANMCLQQILDWGVENIAAALQVTTGEIEARAMQIGTETTSGPKGAAHIKNCWPHADL